MALWHDDIDEEPPNTIAEGHPVLAASHGELAGTSFSDSLASIEMPAGDVIWARGFEGYPPEFGGYPPGAGVVDGAVMTAALTDDRALANQRPQQKAAIGRRHRPR